MLSWDRKPYSLATLKPAIIGKSGLRFSTGIEQSCALMAAGVDHAEAVSMVEQIAGAASPEEAARIGRQAEHSRHELLRPDWATAKLAVMYAGLRAKVHR